MTAPSFFVMAYLDEEGLEKVWAKMKDKMYPVGSIYISTNSTSPASIYGGTWEQIKDTFLLAAGDTYAAGSTGGEASHTLTVDEMPAHYHALLKGYGTDTSVEDEGKIKDVSNIDGVPNRAYGHADTVLDEKYYWWSTTLNEGGNMPHNNMPPYLAVYVWKRTA